MKKLSLFLLLAVFASSELNSGFQGYDENGKAKLTRKQKDSVVMRKAMEITKSELEKRTEKQKREMVGQPVTLVIVREEDGVETITYKTITL